MKRTMIKLACLGAFAVLLTSAICCSINMYGMWSNHAACSITPSTSDDLMLLNALYPETQWTAYIQDSASLSVENDALPARRIQIQMLSFCGDPKLIAFFPLASGRLPHEGESGVCALDMDTAYALFRTTDTEGNRVRVDGDSLLVVGVIDVECPCLMICATQDTYFNRLAANSREELDILTSALGEEIDPFEFSGLEAARVTLLMCLCPVVCIIVFALGALRRRMGWCKEVSNFLLWTLFAGVGLAVIWCIPVRLLPTRWSDFSFYSELLSDFRARDLRLPDARDLLLRSGLFRTGILCLIACVTFRIERKCLKCEKSS